jgi:shikimate dehydrogenase
MQNAALRAASIPLQYDALDVLPGDLDAQLDALVADGAGGNVTIPHKPGVAERCDVLRPAAIRTGAVNTFWTDAGRLVGDNTDPDGFDEAVRELLGELPSDAEVGVFGAGGAAAGVLAAMERWQGCHVRVYNRTANRAAALVRRFSAVATVAPTPARALAGASLVVNATSIGLTDDAIPFAVDQLDAATAVLDLVYRRGGTRLVRAASARGLRAVDGLTMLVGQGAQAFERWFGIAPDRGVMWAALRQES